MWVGWQLWECLMWDQILVVWQECLWFVVFFTELLLHKSGGCANGVFFSFVSCWGVRGYICPVLSVLKRQGKHTFQFNAVGTPLVLEEEVSMWVERTPGNGRSQWRMEWNGMNGMTNLRLCICDVRSYECMEPATSLWRQYECGFWICAIFELYWCGSKFGSKGNNTEINGAQRSIHTV